MKMTTTTTTTTHDGILVDKKWLVKQAKCDRLCQKGVGTGSIEGVVNGDW